METPKIKTELNTMTFVPQDPEKEKGIKEIDSKKASDILIEQLEAGATIEINAYDGELTRDDEIESETGKTIKFEKGTFNKLAERLTTSKEQVER